MADVRPTTEMADIVDWVNRRAPSASGSLVASKAKGEGAPLRPRRGQRVDDDIGG